MGGPPHAPSHFHPERIQQRLHRCMQGGRRYRVDQIGCGDTQFPYLDQDLIRVGTGFG
jgi:hypothetical protein